MPCGVSRLVSDRPTMPNRFRLIGDNCNIYPPHFVVTLRSKSIDKMSEQVPNRFVSMMKMKCPNCHKGNMYSQQSIFPLGKLMDMPERCPVCGQKYELELGFWYGTGYVSYALSVALIAVMAVAYAVLVGFSWKDNSIFYFIGVMIASMVILQPWIMRFSRVLYLYVFVKYGQGSTLHDH